MKHNEALNVLQPVHTCSVLKLSVAKPSAVIHVGI